MHLMKGTLLNVLTQEDSRQWKLISNEFINSVEI
jgi:hypothetical protein